MAALLSCAAQEYIKEVVKAWQIWEDTVRFQWTAVASVQAQRIDSPLNHCSGPLKPVIRQQWISGLVAAVAWGGARACSSAEFDIKRWPGDAG
jgi:hypothetical protein